MNALLAILASYRIAYLVSRERGPFDLAERLRLAIFNRYGEDSWQYTGIDCPLCVSFWTSLAMPFMPRWIRRWLGIAGGVLVIHLALEGLRELGEATITAKVEIETEEAEE